MYGPKAEREGEYRRFVEAGLAETADEFAKFMKKSPRSIGDQRFRKWVDEEYKKMRESCGSKEDVSFRREVDLRDTDPILEIVAKEFGVRPKELKERMYGSLARPVAAMMLCKHAGLSQREAGEMLGYGRGSAVSMQLKRLRVEIDDSRKVRRQVARIDRAIDSY